MWNILWNYDSFAEILKYVVWHEFLFSWAYIYRQVQQYLMKNILDIMSPRFLVLGLSLLMEPWFN